MTAAPPPAAEAEPLDRRDEWVRRHVGVLEELVGIGMDLARGLRDEAVAPAPAEAAAPRPDPARTAQAFFQIARAVRLTLALEAKVRADQAARERDPARLERLMRAREEAEAAARPRVQRRRNVLTNVIPEMIGAQAEREFLANEKELYAEAEELIERDLDDADVLERPMVQLIGVVCQALGVEPDWRLWDPAAWTDQDHGLTQAELAAGCPAGPKPRRIHFPPDPEAADRSAERLAVAAAADP